MNNIDDFFENAKVRNLCARGAKIWEHCGSKKSLIDFCLSGWGCDYVATAISEGWGISPEAIAKDFAPFNNGKYIRDKDGYTSAMYCRPTDAVHVNTTLALIIDCNNEITIDRSACELYIVNSKARITGKGNGAIYLYNSTIVNQSTAPVVVKEDRKYDTQNAI